MSQLGSRLLDEIALAGAEHLDALYVEAYDRKAGFDPTDELAELRERGLDADSTLIDVGAGTGVLALAAAPFCRRVIAIDVSPAMLTAIGARAAERGITNIECVHAGFLSYEHAGAPADVVYTRNALHHLPDFWKPIALHRLAAVLRANGLLRLRDLVFSFAPHEAEGAIGAWLDAAPQRPEDGWTREELEAHLRDEFSTYTWLLEPMLERAGFTIEQADYSSTRIFASYLCTR
jgi:ubiquinone/menaquinone biosynthesis C-methylase UbiE